MVERRAFNAFGEEAWFAARFMFATASLAAAGSLAPGARGCPSGVLASARLSPVNGGR